MVEEIDRAGSEILPFAAEGGSCLLAMRKEESMGLYFYIVAFLR